MCDSSFSIQFLSDTGIPTFPPDNRTDIEALSIPETPTKKISVGYRLNIRGCNSSRWNPKSRVLTKSPPTSNRAPNGISIMINVISKNSANPTNLLSGDTSEFRMGNISKSGIS